MKFHWRTRYWFVAIAAVAAFALTSGCQSKPSASPPPTTVTPPPVTPVTPVDKTQPDSLPANPPQTTEEDNHSSVLTANPPAVAQDNTSSHSSKNVKTSSDANPTKTEESAEPVNYDARKPALMGLKLADTLTIVTQKYGDPTSEYIMEDEVDPLEVYEYDGFTVGFNKKQQITFIEVTSKDVNPGLNGLRLKQSAQDAMTALGKPDINTDYTMSYKAGGTILKLDVDPKTESIQSIKLFADTNV